VVLAGAQIPAECGAKSRTQQITRKRPHKRLDLKSHKSHMAMTPPRELFYAVTRKKIACSAKFVFCGMAGECAAVKSAGNAGMRPATHTTDAYPRPVFSSMGQDCMSFGAACSRRGINPRQSPPRGFCAVGASPEGGESGFRKSLAEKFFAKGFLPFTEVKINCNR
jgi:hypothetical protein